MTFHDPFTSEIEQALARADAARARHLAAIARADQAADRMTAYATEAIRALIPDFTDPKENHDG